MTPSNPGGISTCPWGGSNRDIGSAQLLWRRKKVAAVASQERTAIELCENEAGGSAIGSRNHTGRRRGRFRSRNPVPGQLTESTRGRSGSQRDGLSMPFQGALLVADSLADALLGRGLFHFGSHRAQIVAGRHHGEENDEQASKCQEALESIEPPSLGRSSRVMPEPAGGHRQQKPEKVE